MLPIRSQRGGKKRLLRWGGIGFVGMLVVVAVANVWVLRQGGIIDAMEALPEGRVALVLGASPVLKSGEPNPFFEGRMDAAAQIFHNGTVQRLVVSGDNGRRGYDEPTAMSEALVKRGVPAGALTLDYAGFRTLDSVVRAKNVFGLNQVIIVTDDFHQPRALFLAAGHGLDAVGFASAPVPWRLSAKTRLRELVSRVVACLDLYVFKTRPHFEK